MKNTKKGGALVMAALLLLMTFVGCTRQETDNGTTETAAENRETASETEDADRYTKLVDDDSVSDKLRIYFLALTVPEGTEDKAGDAAVIITPDDHVMMIDSGHPESSDQTVDFLKDLGITKIDAYVESHPHIDHIGGFPAVANAFEIGHVYRTNVEHTTQTYTNFVNAVEEEGCPVTYLKEGDTLDLDSGIHIDIYNPEEEVVYPEKFPEGATQFLNNESLTMKMTYGESTILFAGDLYTSGEDLVLEKYGEELQADVVKANHHGRDTSNQKEWVEALSPEIVVAMDETMQSSTVVKRYIKEGAQYYTTAINGFVRVSMDKNKNYEVLTQKGQALDL